MWAGKSVIIYGYNTTAFFSKESELTKFDLLNLLNTSNHNHQIADFHQHYWAFFVQ